MPPCHCMHGAKCNVLLYKEWRVVANFQRSTFRPANSRLLFPFMFHFIPFWELPRNLHLCVLHLCVLDVKLGMAWTKWKGMILVTNITKNKYNQKLNKRKESTPLISIKIFTKLYCYGYKLLNLTGAKWWWLGTMVQQTFWTWIQNQWSQGKDIP